MRKFLRKAYLNLFGSFRSPSNGVHIINSHFITPDESGEIDKDILYFFLSYLDSIVTFVDLNHAVALLESNREFDRPYVALTFDDGFVECYDYIAPMIEEFGFRGAFFINCNFIDSDITYREQFNRRINTFSKKPMKWEQIIELHERGHVIGSHTFDHFNMKNLDREELEFQICVNKSELEKKLGYSCRFFAWPYGRFEHFSIEALHVCEKHHDFIFSATNYKNYFSYNGRVINRRHIEPFWPVNHINYFLSITKKR